MQRWLQYYEVEPFGEERDDLRAGQIAAAVYNVNRTKQSQRMLTASDFVLRFDRAEQRKDIGLTSAERWREDKAQMKAYARAMKSKREAQ